VGTEDELQSLICHPATLAPPPCTPIIGGIVGIKLLLVEFDELFSVLHLRKSPIQTFLNRASCGHIEFHGSRQFTSLLYTVSVRLFPGSIFCSPRSIAMALAERVHFNAFGSQAVSMHAPNSGDLR
jgi:acyl-coenzyme A synthetase/AMP-(fatty) acid ligase